MRRATELGTGTARSARWPWALAATVAGALAGGAVAYAVRRVEGEERPDAQDPEQVRAVVDRPGDGSAPAG